MELIGPRAHLLGIVMTRHHEVQWQMRIKLKNFLQKLDGRAGIVGSKNQSKIKILISPRSNLLQLSEEFDHGQFPIETEVLREFNEGQAIIELQKVQHANLKGQADFEKENHESEKQSLRELH